MDRNDLGQAAHGIHEQMQIIVNIIEVSSVSGSGRDTGLLLSGEARRSLYRLIICHLHFLIFARVSHAGRKRDITYTEVLRYLQDDTTSVVIVRVVAPRVIYVPQVRNFLCEGIWYLKR
jgi:hypothetical protein